MTRLALAGLAALAACQGVSPLTNQVAVGEEAIVVLVGEGPDGHTDLFAGSTAGGVLHRLTFTREAEAGPAMHPGGGAVAFLRHPVRETDSTTWVVVMNLVNAAEREAVLPRALGAPSRLGWGPAGSRLFIRGANGLAVTPAPPAPLEVRMLAATDPEHAAAEAATSIMLGNPAFARVVPCPGDTLACIMADTLAPQALGVAMGRVLRWGDDSLATISGPEIRVRWLGGGRTRTVRWTGAPAGLREGSQWAPGLSLAAPSSPAPEGISR